MTVLATNVEENNRAMAADGTTNCISATKVNFSTIIIIIIKFLMTYKGQEGLLVRKI